MLISRSINPFYHPIPDGWEIIDSADPQTLFYNNVASNEADRYINNLMKQFLGPMRRGDRVYAGWANIPVGFLFYCTDQGMRLYI
jgi:hypothetical protein